MKPLLPPTPLGLASRYAEPKSKAPALPHHPASPVETHGRASWCDRGGHLKTIIVGGGVPDAPPHVASPLVAGRQGRRPLQYDRFQPDVQTLPSATMNAGRRLIWIAPCKRSAARGLGRVPLIINNIKPLLITLLLFSLIHKATPSPITFHNADTLPLLGKLPTATETHYERLPASLQSTARPPVWYLGKCTAGLALRFRSNTSRIDVRWETLRDTILPHMAPTGVKGLDLYCLENETWTYVRTARPAARLTETTLISGMQTTPREWMIYLPLYDGLRSLHIGLDSAATLLPPAVDLPRRARPIIAYGTSILQGGCASRPGMAHTNILSRTLQREIINLGFSGNALLDYDIATLMAHSNASLFLLDFMPNVSRDQILERLEPFCRILRTAHPNTPILLIENPIYPHSRYNPTLRRTIDDKNAALFFIFEKIKSNGDPHIHLIPAIPLPAIPTTASSSLFSFPSPDLESTVDGVHLTDFGFMRYAEYLLPRLLPFLGEDFSPRLKNFIGMSENFVDMSRDLVDMPRNFIDMSRDLVDMSRNFIDMSRDLVDMSRNFIDMSRDLIDMSRNFVDISENHTASIVGGGVPDAPSHVVPDAPPHVASPLIAGRRGRRPLRYDGFQSGGHPASPVETHGRASHPACAAPQARHSTKYRTLKHTVNKVPALQASPNTVPQGRYSINRMLQLTVHGTEHSTYTPRRTKTHDRASLRAMPSTSLNCDVNDLYDSHDSPHTAINHVFHINHSNHSSDKPAAGPPTPAVSPMHSDGFQPGAQIIPTAPKSNF